MAEPVHSFDDTVQYTSDSSSEEADEEETALGPIAAGQASKRTGWLRRLSSPSGRRELSIQSGDIIRSPPPASSPLSPIAPTMAPGGPEGSAPQASDDSNGYAETVANSTLHSQPSESVSKHKGGCYGALFPWVHLMVRVAFFSIPVKKPKTVIPILSIIKLLANLVFVAIIVAVSITKYPPSINVSIESFGVPSHPAQVHWDALEAAQDKQFIISNTSLPPINTDANALRRKRRASSSHTIQTRSKVVYPECPSPSLHTQYAIHVNWEMDLVFRVPEGNKDDNMLRMDRIAYVHEIEERIYNSTEYKHFCHKRSDTDLCDPLNSLLTWLYPRDQKTGKYIYDTPDGFTPDLPGVVHTLSKNLSVVLWFTGGGVYLDKQNYSSISAKLLRSQIRVGLPLPCFDSTRDRYEEQKEFVTEYFVSLMPLLEEWSTSDVEVLYGGSIIFDYEVVSAIKHDAYLCLGSAILIYLLMFVLSGFSKWLTVTGLYSIVTCFIPAYFVYRVVFGIETIGLLNVISIFVVIGIGVDDVFVFINTFKQSSRLPGLHTPHQKLAHTILESTKATFFTSLTTSVAFFANVISSIPAVQQFGIFMGLIVLFCFIQVFLVIPDALYIWECWFVKLENLCYYPIYYVIFKTRRSNTYSTLPDVRMSDVARDDDSGIDSTASSNSDNISNDSASSQSDSSDVVVDVEGAGSEDDLSVLVVEQAVHDSERAKTFDRKLTSAMQTGMMYVAMVPMTFHLLRSYAASRKPTLSGLLHALNFLLHIGMFIALLGVSVGLLVQLRFNDKPPQFFDPNSNIQKMLDLAGNVTDSSGLNCYNCSAWNSNSPLPSTGGGGSSGGATGGGGSSSGGTGGNGHNSHSTSKPPATVPSAPPPNTRPPSHATPPPTPPPTLPPTQPPRTQPPHTPPPVVTPPSTQPHEGGGGVVTAPTNGGGTPGPPTYNGSDHVTPPKLSSNAPVFVVFGLQDVQRDYDYLHVLPENGDNISAIVDTSFASLFTCPLTSSDAKLVGAMRAMCRICSNISNPDNGLSLEGNYQCVPVSRDSPFLGALSCLGDVAAGLPECASLFPTDTSQLSVTASAGAKSILGGGKTSLVYLAMAFKSTTNLGSSPFDGVKDYQKWEDFLSNELKEIKADPQNIYKGAHEVLSSTFQTSQYWMEVTVETVAVDGSFYGIIISFILCSLVVVLLAHDFRIVFSMVVTIFAILLSLGGLFWCFGWKLGIVEAISLSILVGNSLDYCIHLSEGFVAMDRRHMAFVEKFGFVARAPIRVKRVMAAISFVGVSILSSAVTTILAIFPLLATRIQLFTRFGQILILDTGVAIIYTFFICANCLAFIGPPLSEKLWKKILNAVLTISCTIGFYVFVIIALAAAYGAGHYIPAPDGTSLF